MLLAAEIRPEAPAPIFFRTPPHAGNGVSHPSLSPAPPPSVLPPGGAVKTNGRDPSHIASGRPPLGLNGQPSGAPQPMVFNRQDDTPGPPAMPQGSERILVVEDEPQVRSSIVDQLRSLGYTVVDAGHGDAGLAAFEAAPQSFHLLLTDIVMPGMGGKALAQEVARRWPATKIAFMSGYAEDAIVHQGHIEAGVLLLSKPFRKTELAQMVRQALDAVAPPAPYATAL